VAFDTRPAQAGGQRWRALFPDARPGDPLHWTGYLQTANHQCVECHTTGYEKGYDPEADAYASRWREADVSCEACHGPGSGHVAWARAGGDPGDADRGLPVRFAGRGDWVFDEGAPIARRVGPGEASRVEVDACARCHARRERFTDDDHAGRPFLDAHRPALLEPHLYHADGQPRDEVYVWGSFLQSRMAAAGVTCADCHEPHALRPRAEGNALCIGCHRAEVYDAPGHHHHAAGSEAARCTSCHMPESVVLEVDARREHAFRVPRPDRAERLGTPDVCTGCHAGRPPRWAAETIEAWYGPERPPAWRFPEALARFRAVRPGAGAALAQIVSDAREPAIARATAVHALGAVLDAATAPALIAALGDSDPLVRMAAAEAAEGLPPAWRRNALAPLLDDPVRVVRMAAARSLAGVGLGGEDATRHAAALDELWAAARHNADRPEARLAASLLHARLGDLEAARGEAEAALAIDPGWPPAAANLADLLRARGRDDLGEGVLREALARSPESAELHHALGLLLVRRGRTPAAAEALGRAAALAGDGRFAYAHGLALVELGRAGEGLEVLARALDARPGDRRLLTALATLHRDRGEREAARRYARRLVEAAPGDPRAAALLAELEPGSP
jgi:tetratricopeptide (TPR) repeat protein